jgi:hypothetical protein
MSVVVPPFYIKLSLERKLNLTLDSAESHLSKKQSSILVEEAPGFIFGSILTLPKLRKLFGLIIPIWFSG